MTSVEVIDVARQGLFVMIKLGAPAMLVALLVGLVVSLIQAMTQMQEMTLSFVPKILAMFLTMMAVLPFMLSTITGFGEELFRRIAAIG